MQKSSFLFAMLTGAPECSRPVKSELEEPAWNVCVDDADVSALSRSAQCEQVTFPHLNRHIGRQRTKSEVWFNSYSIPDPCFTVI